MTLAAAVGRNFNGPRRQLGRNYVDAGCVLAVGREERDVRKVLGDAWDDWDNLTKASRVSSCFKAMKRCRRKPAHRLTQAVGRGRDGRRDFDRYLRVSSCARRRCSKVVERLVERFRAGQGRPAREGDGGRKRPNLDSLIGRGSLSK